MNLGRSDQQICPGAWGLTGCGAAAYSRDRSETNLTRFHGSRVVCSHLVFLVVAEDDVHHSWYLVIVEGAVCWMHKSCMVPLH